MSTIYKYDYSYWAMFKSLERELLSLTSVIDINSDQINVYSTKIADLLNRTVTEIETLSKKLFFDNGGTWSSTTKEPYFDTTCLKFLNDIWCLEKKKVYVTSPYIHFTVAEREKTPLLGVHQWQIGDWKNASNAVKHDRAKCLHEGTLGRFIDALAALFLLNVYNNNVIINLGNTADNFNPSMGSDVFAVKKHPFPGIDSENTYKIAPDYDECVYLIRATKETAAKAAEAIAEMNNMIADEVMNLAVKRVNDEFRSHKVEPSVVVARIQQYIPELKSSAIALTAKKVTNSITSAFVAVKYEAVLNKNQYKETDSQTSE